MPVRGSEGQTGMKPKLKELPFQAEMGTQASETIQAVF